MKTLSLKDVRYLYKTKSHTVRAVDGVNYDFLPGTFYAVVGRSGSGKTTLLSMLGGLDIPTEGSVSFGEKDTKDIDRDRFRLDNISIIYQSLNLLPLLTAMENVTFPLTYRGIPKAEATKIAAEKLKSVGIDPTMHRRLPSMLSGGEQQRVAIARALAAKTEVILADEPTGNLDTENSQNIVQLLKELATRENVCVIVVTHDMAVAEQADMVVKISDGRIVA
ncbi:MAG: ABC transporter ATP-binding protein [Defluviitaleaceae bacterium]|nr:ABC transporter ATP-binding protein [Defluviitaleaceae bacterium]